MVRGIVLGLARPLFPRVCSRQYTVSVVSCSNETPSTTTENDRNKWNFTHCKQRIASPSAGVGIFRSRIQKPRLAWPWTDRVYTRPCSTGLWLPRVVCCESVAVAAAVDGIPVVTGVAP